MKKDLELSGIGNAIVDVLISVTDEQFEELHLAKGGMSLVTEADQAQLFAGFGEAPRRQASGGSVGNSIVAFAQQGGKAAFISCVGSDELGTFYREECRTMGIEFPVASKPNSATGSCAVLITPDAERTMCTHLGAAVLLSGADLDEEVIARSSWLFIEGYLLSNPSIGIDTVRTAVMLAREHHTKIALTLSESWVVDVFGEVIQELVPHLDLLFANEHEVVKLYNTGKRTDGIGEAISRVGKDIRGSVVTLGAGGAAISIGGEHIRIPAVPCVPVDLTGAGDMFAGTFLYEHLRGRSAETAGRRACEMAAKVITQVGARLTST